MAQKQIHELNTYSGTPAAGTYFAADNGTTTTKLDYDALATAIIAKLGGNPVTIAHGGTGATSAADARTALSVYTKAQTDSAISTAVNTATADINLNVDGTTFATLYAILSKIPNSASAACYFTTNAASTLSGSKVTSGGGAVVSRFSGGSTFAIMMAGNTGSGSSNAIYTWRVTGWSSASTTPTISTVYRYSGTAI